MKRIAAAVGLGLLLLAGVLVGRALRAGSRQIAAVPAAPLAVDADQAADRLAGAVRFRTVSYQDPAQFDGSQFRQLHDYLAQHFPLVHRALQRETVNDYSLLYTWPGRGAAGRGAAAPVVLLAHLDVVPVEPGTEADWTQPPFAGAVADGAVWGRGTLDDKGSALAILEATELLLARGFQPEHTVYLAFGHDEELSGRQGAVAMAERLRARGVQPAFVLDEGGAIIEGLVPGIAAPVASVGMAEKGYVSVELTAQAVGGHSSIPPRRTAIGVLSAAVDRLERQPVPANIRAAMGASFDYLGPELPLLERVVFANLWLFGPLVEWQLSQAPQTNATIRTTTAPTVFNGGVKDNVLPSSARAVVNFRILPGDTVASVLAHVRRAIDDPTVQVGVLGEGDEPSPVSRPGTPAFEQVSRTIRAVFPGTLVTPFLSLGATDARHYVILTPNVYRFAPQRLQAADLARIHGTNERLPVADYVGMVRFYAELLRQPAPAANGGPGVSP